jgi:hypothetical protein
MQLSLLVAEHLDLVDMKAVLSELSKEDREMYMNNSIYQPIARDDDDVEMKKIYKNNSGYKDIYTFDANKHYSSVLKFRKRPYLVATMLDTWEEFDEKLHGDIPYVEYLLKLGDYKCTRTNLFFNHNLYTYIVVRELLDKKIINKNDISHIRKIKQLLPANYFEDFIDKVYSILPPKYAKQLVNLFIGGLNMLTNKKAYYLKN